MLCLLATGDIGRSWLAVETSDMPYVLKLASANRSVCRWPCYILSFAIIMLNTSLHNPNVKDKPPVERFISMNRGINEGGDLPEDLLRVSTALKLTVPLWFVCQTFSILTLYFIDRRTFTRASKTSPSKSQRMTATTSRTHSSTQTERAGC